MKTILLFLVIALLSGSVIGQEEENPHTIYIEGIVKELHTMTPVPNAEVCVISGSDTLKRTTSDAKGNYNLTVDTRQGDQLEVSGMAKHHDPSRNLLIVTSPILQDYHLDVELVYQTVSHAPPRILFEAGSLQPIPFDLTMYRELLEDNPKVCLEIELYSHPDDPEKLTKKRLEQFEKYLVSENFPMNQVDFNFTHHVRNCKDNETCLTELFFEISSLEGHCLQE